MALLPDIGPRLVLASRAIRFPVSDDQGGVTHEPDEGRDLMQMKQLLLKRNGDAGESVELRIDQSTVLREWVGEK